jgi:hypothetical protein
VQSFERYHQDGFYIENPNFEKSFIFTNLDTKELKQSLKHQSLKIYSKNHTFHTKTKTFIPNTSKITRIYTTTRLRVKALPFHGEALILEHITLKPKLSNPYS